MLRRPLVPADFARLRVYAPLVKIVAEPPHICIKDVLSPSVWSSFREHDIGSLFNLSGIHYVRLSALEETQRLADPIHHFIGPSLAEFFLTLQGGKDYEDLIEDPEGLLEAKPDPVLLDVLAHLSSTCPRLRNFELDTTPFPFYAANALSNAVCRWSHLRSFEAHTCPLKPEAWKHLAALPWLRVLNVFVDIPTEVLKEVLVPGPQDPLVFPALRHLTLHARRLETCAILIELIESMTLSKISLYTYDHASPGDIENVCDALAACVFRDAIQELLIKPGCTIHDPDRPTSSPQTAPGPSVSAPAGSAQRLGGSPYPHEPLPPTVLAPLLSLKSLHNLSLLGPCFSSLHNTTLAAIAQELPNLWTAVLCPDAAPNQGVTLAGLGVLAGLKDLHSIQVPLAHIDERAVADAFFYQRNLGSDPSSHPTPGPASSSAVQAHDGLPPAPLEVASEPAPDDNIAHRGSTSRQCHGLRYINVGYSRISEGCVEGAAAALSAWFPRLVAVNVSVDPDSEEPVLRAMGFRDRDDAAGVNRRWEQVGSLVASFALVRRQEREWDAKNRSSREGS